MKSESNYIMKNSIKSTTKYDKYKKKTIYSHINNEMGTLT